MTTMRLKILKLKIAGPDFSCEKCTSLPPSYKYERTSGRKTLKSPPSVIRYYKLLKYDLIDKPLIPVSKLEVKLLTFYLSPPKYLLIGDYYGTNSLPIKGLFKYPCNFALKCI